MITTLPARYLRYARECAGWKTPAMTWDEYRAYWDVFGRRDELMASSAAEYRSRNVPVGTSAPILVQRFGMQGQIKSGS
jgi:hypothetical protein